MLVKLKNNRVMKITENYVVAQIGTNEEFARLCYEQLKEILAEQPNESVPIYEYDTKVEIVYENCENVFKSTIEEISLSPLDKIVFISDTGSVIRECELIHLESQFPYLLGVVFEVLKKNGVEC